MSLVLNCPFQSRASMLHTPSTELTAGSPDERGPT